MNIAIILSLASTLVFGTIAILISIRKDKESHSSAQDPKETLKRKKDFTYMVVHELRAPLISIKDSAELLISNKYHFDEGEKKQFLEIIEKQAKLLLDQVGTILDSAKLEANKFTITKAAEDLGKVIAEQIEIFLPEAKKKNISLTYDTPSNLPRFSFDLIRISQVLNNLLSNSLKFTEKEGAIKVKIAYKPSDKYVHVFVSDTGIGIPKEFQKGLFSKFTQVATNSKDLEKNGTGLGLYVVKGIVEAHGGNVNLESEVGRGTTISFTLPIENQEMLKA